METTKADEQYLHFLNLAVYFLYIQNQSTKAHARDDLCDRRERMTNSDVMDIYRG